METGVSGSSGLALLKAMRLGLLDIPDVYLSVVDGTDGLVL